VIIILTISNYLETKLASYPSKISNDFKEGNKGYNTLKLYSLCFVTGYSLKLIVNIFNSHLIGAATRSGYRNFFAEYLSIKFYKFQEIGIGEAQYNIIRRANSLSEFLTLFLMAMLSNVLFLVIAIKSVIDKMTVLIQIKIGLVLTLFFITSFFIQYLRSKVRRKVNNGMQTNSRKLYDILLNYERIIAYDNIDVECEKYWKCNSELTKYATIYWVTREIVGAINSLVFLLLNAYIIYNINLSNEISSMDFQSMLVLLSMLRDKVLSMSKNIDELFTSFANMDQSVIEGAKQDYNEERGIVDLDVNDRESVNMKESVREGESVNMKESRARVRNGDNDKNTSNINNDVIDHNIKNDKTTNFSNLSGRSTIMKAENLSIGYNDSIEVCKGINVEIKKGDKIAIVGVNGGGKSTFIKTLLGLYEYKGSLQIGGQEYKNINRKSIRESIAYIPQKSHLFDTSLLENLRIGNETVSDEELVEFCKLYGMHETFKELGYNKQVGERGRNLSGGQRQKVCFMRAVIKNSPILVLDESTSNMDEKSEKNLLKKIQENMKEQTVFMIIHNLSILEQFSKIFFFRDRKLFHGSYKEMIEGNEDFRVFLKNGSTE